MSLIQKVTIPRANSQLLEKNYQLYIYRGDCEHAHAPGNKWHKLKHHLIEAENQKAEVLATFGGPFSNHIHAFANTLGNTSKKGVCIVRGELHPDLTPTLQDAVRLGIELWPSSRRDYRLADQSQVVKNIEHYYGNVYWIPEGGGGELGAKGCMEWADIIAGLDQEFDAWAVSAGTGTTAAGVLACQNIPLLHVFSSLKGAHDQQYDIIDLAQRLTPHNNKKEGLDKKLIFHDDCHEGGYAKHSSSLLSFLANFADLNPTQILDPIYTCKTMYGIVRRMHSGEWPHNRTLLIHTGGIQGWRGYSEKVNVFSGGITDSES